MTPKSSQARHPLTKALTSTLLAALILFACSPEEPADPSSKPNDGTGGDSGEGDGDGDGDGDGGEAGCSRGEEACSCLENQTCDADLVCLSGVCVDPEGLGNGSGGMGGATGTGGASPGSGGLEGEDPGPDERVVIYITNGEDGEPEAVRFARLVDDVISERGSLSASTATDEKIAGGLRLSPTGDSFLYYVRRGYGSPHDLFLVKVGNNGFTSPMRLNSPLSAEGDIGSFTYSGDGTYLVYTARDAPGVAATPFIVDVSGAVPSEPTPINTDPLQQPYVMGWVGHTVLYSQYILMSSEAEIYASTVSNGVPDEPVLVSSDGGEGTAGGVLSPDKRSLIYSRIPEAGPATVYFVEDVLEPLPVALTGPNLTGRSSLGFHWSPDSSRIVIVSMPFPEESPRQTYILDTERLDLGAVRLNTNLPEGGSTWRSGSWSPNSQATCYMADQYVVGEFELRCVDVSETSPGAPALVSAGVHVLDSFAWAPDGRGLAFARTNQSGGSDLYFAPAPDTIPQSPARVNPLLPNAQTDMQTFEFSPQGGYLLYRAQQYTLDAHDLMLVDMNGGTMATPQRLTLQPSNTRIGSFQSFSMDDRYALHLEQASLDAANVLYVTRLGEAGGLLPVPLSLPEEDVLMALSF